MAMKLPLVAPVYMPGQEPAMLSMSEQERANYAEALKYQKYMTNAMESCLGKAAISGVLGFGLGAFFSMMSASFAIEDPVRQTMLDRAAAERAQKAQAEATAKTPASGAVAASQTPAAAAVRTASTVDAAGSPAAALGTASAPAPAVAKGAPLSSTGRMLSKLPGGSYFQNLPAPPPQLPAATMQSTKEFFIQTGKSMYSSGRGFAKVGALYSGIECCVESFRAKNDIVNPVVGGFIAGGVLARNTGPQTALGSAVAFAAFSGAIDLFLRRETKDDD